MKPLPLEVFLEKPPPWPPVNPPPLLGALPVKPPPCGPWKPVNPVELEKSLWEVDFSVVCPSDGLT